MSISVCYRTRAPFDGKLVLLVPWVEQGLDQWAAPCCSYWIVLAIYTAYITTDYTKPCFLFKKFMSTSHTHAKLFVRWLQGTRCNSESSAWQILDPSVSLHGRSPGRKGLPWLIELVFWCLHVCSPSINEGSANAICILLRNTTFSWIRLGELPLPSGKLGWLRGSETPCKKAWNGGRNGRDVSRVAFSFSFFLSFFLSLSLSLSLSPLHLIKTKRGTQRWGRVLPTQATVEWFVKFQMPDAISQPFLEHAPAPHWVGPLMKIRQ